MLFSIVFILQPCADLTLPPTLGDAIYACFLNLVGERDRALAAKLHSSRKDKPFTVSPLQGGFDPRNGKIYLPQGREYWLRFTGLDKDLSEVFMDLDKEAIGGIRIFDGDFDVVRIAKDEREHPWAARTTYDDLYRKWAVRAEDPPSKIRMRFFSPTTFRSGGRNMPLPLPELVFQSLLDRWNRYACTHPGSELKTVIKEEMALSRYGLETQMMDFGKYRQVGFTGECEFLLGREVNEAFVRWAHLLADFAFFSGVGYRTTMGMGQARKVE